MRYYDHYFLGNTCAKNYRNRAMYVKIIGIYSKSMVVRFFETRCSNGQPLFYSCDLLFSIIFVGLLSARPKNATLQDLYEDVV